jgi:hypothetical protein
LTTTSALDSFSQHGVTPSFKCIINVVNDGESIIFKDKMISSGETVMSKTFTNGYTPLNIKLPSNTSLDKQKMSFKKSRYKFIISNISDSFSSDSSPFVNSSLPTSDDTRNKYSDVTLDVQELKSSIEKSGKTYYLTSELIGVRTRMKINPGEDATTLQAYELILSEDISINDDLEVVRQKLRDSGEFEAISSNIFSTEDDYDESKIFLMANIIIDFIKNNPELDPPSPYKSSNQIQNFIINCKINGTLILSDKLTKIPEENTGLISQYISSYFPNLINQNNASNSTTKVLNIKFEENPVIYSQPKRFDELNAKLLPVEPFL